MSTSCTNLVWLCVLLVCYELLVFVYYDDNVKTELLLTSKLVQYSESKLNIVYQAQRTRQMGQSEEMSISYDVCRSTASSLYRDVLRL